MKQKTVTPTADPSAVRRALGYVGPDDVAALLGISPATLKNRLSIGTAPPSYKVGNRHLFKTSELDAWIRRRRVERQAA